MCTRFVARVKGWLEELLRPCVGVATGAIGAPR